MKQAFSKECENRGFIRCGKSYMRIIGDGVFQHILLGVKEHLHSSAPGYSQFHRYEPRILIYLKSMYARYDGLNIGIDNTTGFALTVPQLLDKQDASFMGATAEMERMLNEGLDLLDEITSQHQIIEYLEPQTYDKCEGQQGYSTQLYDVYLYCEEFYKARMAIQTEFARNYFAHMSNCERDPARFAEEMRQFQDRAASYYERDRLTFPVHHNAAKARLRENFEINSRRLKELAIQHK